MTNLFNFEEIKQQVKDVITYSQGIKYPQIDELMGEWLKNKSKYIEAFGGELIYQYPEKVSFKLDNNQKQRELDDFIVLLDENWGNHNLADFIYEMKDCFYSNITDKDYYIDEEHLIKKGTKIIKAFKYFEFDKEYLNEIQSYASRLLQIDKIEGHMCVSVHPLDYLSISENAHNWRSCHALNGEHRSGNLNYIADESTVIVYLKSEEDEKIPRFPFKWNSKKWRSLIYFSTDMTMSFSGRPYPFECIEASNFINAVLLPNANLYKWGYWFNTKVHMAKMESVDKEHKFENMLDYVYIPTRFPWKRNKFLDLNELFPVTPGTYHFNDVILSTCYDAYYSFVNNVNLYNTGNLFGDLPDPVFDVGRPVKCLHCGEEYIKYGEAMLCENCINEYISDNEEGDWKNE